HGRAIEPATHGRTKGFGLRARIRYADGMIARFAFALLISATAMPAAEIERIWLTHRSNDPSKIVVNWETPEPAVSVLEAGPTTELDEEKAFSRDPVKLHHIEIPTGQWGGKPWFYRVRSGTQTSAVHEVQGYPEDELRVAVVADTGYTKANWGDAVLA